jgi:hypothetical protein
MTSVDIAETANTGELMWLGVGLMTGAVNTVLWVIATRDLKAVYAARQNGAKRIEAWTWFWAHAMLVAVQGVAVGIGLYAAAHPSADPQRGMSKVGMVLAAGLIAMQLTHCGLGVFLIFRRGMLDSYLDGAMHPSVPTERVTVQEAVDIVEEQQAEAAARRLEDVTQAEDDK